MFGILFGWYNLDNLSYYLYYTDEIVIPYTLYELAYLRIVNYEIIYS